MTNELKPCPFCGGEAEIVKGGVDWIAEPFRNNLAIVSCRYCHAMSNIFAVNEHHDRRAVTEQAIKAWNRRETASQTTLDELIKDRMREALEKWEQQALERMRARMAEDKPYYYLGRFSLDDTEGEDDD